MDEPAKPQLTHSERIFVRMSIEQTVMALVGIFTGALALYAALNEADAVRIQLDATVWPNIEPGTERWSKESVSRRDEYRGVGGPLFRVTVLNSGIGPAKIGAVRVAIDGVAYRDRSSSVNALTGEQLLSSTENFQFGTSTIGDRVIPAGALIYPLTLLGPRAEKVIASINDAIGVQRANMTICYCSVFDKCWVTEDSDGTNGAPEPVKKCPDFGDDEFEG